MIIGYALVKEGRIDKFVSCKSPGSDSITKKPGGWVDVIKMWERPTEYPTNFYRVIKSSKGLKVNGSHVIENWQFELKSVEELKTEIYQQQEEERFSMQLGSFEFAGANIAINDREDSLIISSLPEVETRFKVGRGQWAEFTSEDVAALKSAHNDHVQAAYDWEMTKNKEVAALLTHDEILHYKLANTQEETIL